MWVEYSQVLPSIVPLCQVVCLVPRPARYAACLRRRVRARGLCMWCAMMQNRNERIAMAEFVGYCIQYSEDTETRS